MCDVKVSMKVEIDCYEVSFERKDRNNGKQRYV